MNGQLKLFDKPAPTAATHPAGGCATAPIDTRRAAHEQIAPVTGPNRAAVLAFITAQGKRGATDHEVTYELGMLSDTARSCRCGLRDLGLVEDSGRTRWTPSGRRATVWVATGDLAAAAAAGIDAAGGEVRKMRIGLSLPGLMCQREKEGRCPWCGGRRWWVSIHGVKTCQNCHPPAVEELVVRRSDGD